MPFVGQVSPAMRSGVEMPRARGQRIGLDHEHDGTGVGVKRVWFALVENGSHAGEDVDPGAVVGGPIPLRSRRECRSPGREPLFDAPIRRRFNGQLFSGVRQRRVYTGK